VVTIRALLIEELGFDPDEPVVERRSTVVANVGLGLGLGLEGHGHGGGGGVVKVGMLGRGSGLLRAIQPGALAGALPRATELSGVMGGAGRPEGSIARAYGVAAREPTVAEVAATLARAQVAPAQQGGQAVAVVRTESGRLYVLPDRCPHDGGAISDGFVEGEQIVCARHGWEIEACSGRCPRAESRDAARAPLPAAPLVALLPPRLRVASASEPPQLRGVAPTAPLPYGAGASPRTQHLADLADLAAMGGGCASSAHSAAHAAAYSSRGAPSEASDS
jgi:nitrite reductase/ring-hydroxylating ferredoxin subunit